jgi:hypothetical protein
MGKKEKSDLITLTATNGKLLFSRFEIFQFLQNGDQEKIAYGCVYPNGKVVIFDSLTANMTLYESIYSLIVTLNMFGWKVVWMDSVINMEVNGVKN